MKTSLVAGSRDSTLALVQTEQVVGRIKSLFPDISITLKTFKTQGDLIIDRELSKIGDKGLFVKELEYALLDGNIDFAVHSMKDMPSEQPNGLNLITFGKRETPMDAFVSKTPESFWTIPPGSVVGTSSLRRQALLKSKRRDLRFEFIRGNVPTRLKKLENGHYDAIVIAAAGLKRLNLENRINHLFSPQELLPACCQGALAVEIADTELFKIFQPFVDVETSTCTEAERAFLKKLQGGCQIPMAAYASYLDEEKYKIRGMLSDLTGDNILQEEMDFTSKEAHVAGEKIAGKILEKGGSVLLSSILQR